VKNYIVISLLTVLLFQNIFAIYTGVFFADDTQFQPTCKSSSQSDELSFTAADCDVINQFIFDSEFKNVNANISVFEEHKNLISESKSIIDQIPVLIFSDLFSGLSAKSFFSSVHFFILNSCKLALQSNLYSFRT
jgi:hypothetical protein